MELRHFLVSLIMLACTMVANAQVPDFVELAEKAGPSVVNISTTRTVKGGAHPGFRFGGPGGQQFNDMLERFFGPQGFQTPDYNAESLGSGFFVTEDGYLLTNYHVIREADSIVVGVPHGEEYEATVVGFDGTSDLALLKIDIKERTPFLTFGSSEEMKVGEWVMAIGSPFGYEQTVTQGIISAKGRGLRTDQYVPFLQTDVAINPGNSGGPLLNGKGEVIGVNAQIVSQTGGYLGLSFAIPSDVAKDVVKQLRNVGKVDRGYLGIAFQNIDKNLAESFGLKQAKGALVAQVMPESPAAKAGFKEGDVILKFDGKPVEDATQLPHLVGFTKPGTMVKVELVRDGKPKTLTVEIGTLTGQEPESPNDAQAEQSNVIGVDVRELTPDEKSQAEVTSGLVVTAVTSGSPASKAGIRPGDLILALNRKDMTTLKDFQNEVKTIQSGQVISVLMMRSGMGQRYLAFKVE